MLVATPERLEFRVDGRLVAAVPLPLEEGRPAMDFLRALVDAARPLPCGHPAYRDPAYADPNPGATHFCAECACSREGGR